MLPGFLFTRIFPGEGSSHEGVKTDARGDVTVHGGDRLASAFGIATLDVAVSNHETIYKESRKADRMSAEVKIDRMSCLNRRL